MPIIPQGGCPAALNINPLTITAMTAEQFYNKCNALKTAGDFFGESYPYIFFFNGGGCKLAQLNTITGTYKDF